MIKFQSKCKNLAIVVILLNLIIISKANILDNVFSKYDDKKFTHKSEFSSIFKLKNIAKDDLIIQFDYSRRMNSIQVTAYKEIKDGPKNKEILYFNSDFNTGDSYIILEEDKCFHESMPTGLKLSVNDFDAFWFYGFLELPDTISN